MAKGKTLIIVEDRNGLVRDTTILRQVNASIRDALEDEEIITTGFVPQAELTALQAELGTDYTRTALGTIGQRLGAGQVIYAEVTAYQLELGGGVFQPGMAMNVKVIDIDEGVRSFPPEVDPETGIAMGQAVVPVRTEMKAELVTIMRMLMGQPAPVMGDLPAPVTEAPEEPAQDAAT